MPFPVPVALLLGCLVHTPISVVPSTSPLPETYRVGERVTVESCGDEGMDEMLSEALAGHDALLMVALTSIYYQGPFSFLMPLCFELSGTQVDFGASGGSRRTSTSSADQAEAGPARPPEAAVKTLEQVYRTIGVEPPTDEDAVLRDAQALVPFLRAGKTPDDIVSAAKQGAKTKGKRAAIADIIAAGFEATEALPTKDAFESTDE